MNNLKSCPFCGGVAKLNAPDYVFYVPYWCKCTRCGAEGPTASSKLEAETGWNKRVQDQEEQIKNRDESLEKAREEIKWLRGMLKKQEGLILALGKSDAVNEFLNAEVERLNGLLKEQEAVKPRVTSVEQRCGNCNKAIEMDGWKACPWCGKPILWEAVGRSVKWK